MEALHARGWKADQLDGLLSGNLLGFLRESLPPLSLDSPSKVLDRVGEAVHRMKSRPV